MHTVLCILSSPQGLIKHMISGGSSSKVTTIPLIRKKGPKTTNAFKWSYYTCGYIVGTWDPIVLLPSKTSFGPLSVKDLDTIKKCIAACVVDSIIFYALQYITPKLNKMAAYVSIFKL